METDWVARVIGLTGVSLAAVSLGWQIYINRAILKITIHRATMGPNGGGAARECIAVMVANTGRMTTELLMVRLVLGQGQTSWKRYVAWWRRPGIEPQTMLDLDVSPFVGTFDRFPGTLDPGKTCTIYYDRERVLQAMTAGSHTKVFAIANSSMFMVHTRPQALPETPPLTV